MSPYFWKYPTNTFARVVVSSKCDSLLVVAFRQPLKDEIEGVCKLVVVNCGINWWWQWSPTQHPTQQQLL